MAAKKKLVKISLREFKAWMDGVEDVQEDDWVPSKAQWDKIREKISLIEDNSESFSPPVANNQQYPVQLPYNHNQQPPRDPNDPFNFAPHPLSNAVIIDNPGLRIPGPIATIPAGGLVVPSAGVAVNPLSPPDSGTDFI